MIGLDLSFQKGTPSRKLADSTYSPQERRKKWLRVEGAVLTPPNYLSRHLPICIPPVKHPISSFTLVIKEVSESKEGVCVNGWESQEVAKLTCRSLSVAGSSQQT